MTWRLLKQLAGAGVLLLVCGAVYWVLEPTTPTFTEGLWLAFVTAATVGYGDVVPTTAASKAFSIVVVLLGFAVLSLVTAAIAAMWVGSQERQIEGEILRDLHAQMRELRAEIAALRHAQDALHQRITAPDGAPESPAAPRTAASRPSRTAER